MDKRESGFRACEELAARKLGDGAVVQTFEEDGYWSADAASSRRCVGVYGFDAEVDALNALAGVLEKAVARG